jgi:ABC-type glycerol-3-phosphate transport system permease component
MPPMALPAVAITVILNFIHVWNRPAPHQAPESG